MSEQQTFGLINKKRHISRTTIRLHDTLGFLSPKLINNKTTNRK